MTETTTPLSTSNEELRRYADAALRDGSLSAIDLQDKALLVTEGRAIVLDQSQAESDTAQDPALDSADLDAELSVAAKDDSWVLPPASLVGSTSDDGAVAPASDIPTSSDAAETEGSMDVTLGRDTEGIPLIVDLAEMPHILIGGAAGFRYRSGLNPFLSSLLMRYTPDEVRMILIGSEDSGVRQYEGTPHLLTPPVTDPHRAVNAFRWAVQEMERRLEFLDECRCNDIDRFNAAFDRGEFQVKEEPISPDFETPQYRRLPRILLVVDELADLTSAGFQDVEEATVRLGQIGQRVGIHLVIATQRPTVDSVTGLMRAAVPARISYAVPRKMDSLVILGTPGAESLRGKGDMLFLSPATPTPQRIQGAQVVASDIKKITDHWREQIDG